MIHFKLHSFTRIGSMLLRCQRCRGDSNLNVVDNLTRGSVSVNTPSLCHVTRLYSQDSTKVSDWESVSDADVDALYPEHIPTTSFQKVLLSIGSALVTITDPRRGDMLAAFGEVSGHSALCWMKKNMESDPVGRQILLERPRINTRTVDLNFLRTLEIGTFGKSYVTWLDENHASPDARLPVHFVDDRDLCYVMQRYREIHDLVHCLLGMPTNMIGEVTVKVFEGIQTRLPMCVTGGMFGPVRLGRKHAALYFQTHLPWALRNGFNAKNVMNFYFEQHWEDTVDELRRHLNIEDPPYTPAKRQKYQ